MGFLKQMRAKHPDDTFDIKDYEGKIKGRYSSLYRKDGSKYKVTKNKQNDYKANTRVSHMLYPNK